MLDIIILPIIFQAAVKSREYNRESEIAWWFFFSSQVLMLILDLIWIVSTLIFNNPVGFSMNLILYMSHVIFFSIGLLKLPHIKVPIIPTLRRIADIGIVMCIIFIAIWTLIVDKIVQFGMTDSVTLVVTIAFVIIEFAFSYIIIGVFLRNAGQLKKRPVSFLLIAATFQATSAAIFGYILLRGGYVSGGISDYLMVISYLLIGAAAIMQITQKQPKIPLDCTHKAWYMNIHLNYQIPAIFGIFVYLLLIWIYFYNPRIFLSMLLAASIVIGLVVFRQVLQMEEMKTAQKVAEKNQKIAEQNQETAEKNRLVAEENRIIAEENEKKFRAIIENSIDAIILVSSDNKILTWNKGAERIFGYTSQEAMHKSMEMLVPSEYVEQYKQGLMGAVSKGGFNDNQIFETIGLRKDGTTMPLEQSVTFWKGKNGIIFAAIVRDVSDRRLAEYQLKKSLDEKNLLLLEIHHRVKNHLQIISSLINLLSFTIEDVKTKNTLLEIQNRIKTIAMIHGILYQTHDMSKVEMKTYVNDILQNLSSTYKNTSQKIDIVLDIDDVSLNMETATPCGLMLNELITNSFKYAFLNETSGKIDVSLKKENNDYLLLTIADDGVGLDENLNLESTKTLGLRLVNSLVRQISGSIELKRDHGTQFEIRFKEAEYEDRI
jgi:PAS domain S-box-containing protein